MDLLNMIIGPKAMNFIRKLNRGIFYLSSHSFEISDLLRDGRWQQMQNFSSVYPKIVPARSKTHQNMGHK